MDELIKTLKHLTIPGATDPHIDTEWLSDFVTHWRQLTEAERKAMVQLEEIRSRLITKETELSLLQADINMLAVDRDNKVQEIEGLTAQLNILKHENETSLKHIQKFEVELEDLRTKNNQLSDELLKKSEQLKFVEETPSKSDDVNEELRLKMKELDGKISELEIERNKLIKDRNIVEKGKEDQIKGLQGALSDALEAKIKLQNKYEKDIRDLQESNSSLVDDFEWKLRQIESTCKKKIQEKEKQIEEKVKEARQISLVDVTAEKSKLEVERKAVADQLRQVAHFKAYEVEVTQLRGVTHEQQKSLRAAARQLDQLKFNEKIMQDELHGLKTLLEKEKTHCQVITNSAQRRMDLHEETMKTRLERQISEVNTKWESKLKDECAKLTQDLSRLQAEEKRLAAESMKSQIEQDISIAKQSWERARQDLVQEISRLKDQMTAKESSCHREIAKATTLIDRDNWELRKKVEKMGNAHLEELESLKESHSQEMELLRTKYKNAVFQLDKLKKRVEEFEKTSRSTDSVETEKDSGFAAGESSQSIVDHTNNEGSDECSSEEVSEEESEEDEIDEEEEGKTQNFDGQNLLESTKLTENSNNSIIELREEVATLQDSIETLTLSLVKNEKTQDGMDDPGNLDAIDPPALIPNESETSESVTSETENSSSMRSQVSSETDESEGE